MEHEHHFTPIGGRGGYFKIGLNNMPDQNKSYTRLYCISCGETKEILNYDHTPTPQLGKGERE